MTREIGVEAIVRVVGVQGFVGSLEVEGHEQ